MGACVPDSQGGFRSRRGAAAFGRCAKRLLAALSACGISITRLMQAPMAALCSRLILGQPDDQHRSAASETPPMYCRGIHTERPVYEFTTWTSAQPPPPRTTHSGRILDRWVEGEAAAADIVERRRYQRR